MAGNIFEVDWIVPNQLVIPSGTSHTFIPVIKGQLYVDVMPVVGGGSLFITGYGISRGTTTSLTQTALTPTLVNGASLGFAIPYGTPYKVYGPAAFWMIASGATTTVMLAYGCRNTNQEF